jgi:hypothetical protein
MGIVKADIIVTPGVMGSPDGPNDAQDGSVNGVADARSGTRDKSALAFELQIHMRGGSDEIRSASSMMLVYVFGTATVMLRNFRPPV